MKEAKKPTRRTLASTMAKVTDIVKQILETGRASEPEATPTNRALGNSYATAQLAAAARNVRHSLIQSYRQNNHGLPMGISRQQYRAALAVEKAVKCMGEDETINIGETRIHNADTVLGVVRKNRELRSKHRKPKKLERQLINRRVLNVADFMAKHRAKLRENKRIGRVPYVRPRELAA